MNILFDADVILDVVLDREPHEISAYKLLTLVEKGYIKGWLGSGTVNTLYFFMSNELEQKWVQRHILEILEMFQIIPVTNLILEKAVKSNIRDFEDAVLGSAADEQGLDYIVTRNADGFKKCNVPVYRPEELLSILESL